MGKGCHKQKVQSTRLNQRKKKMKSYNVKTAEPIYSGLEDQVFHFKIKYPALNAQLFSKAELFKDHVQDVFGGGDADNGVELIQAVLEINGKQVAGHSFP